MKKLSIFALSMLLIALFFPVLFHSCEHSEIEDAENDDVLFTYISACGWCAGSEELNIRGNEASYQYHAVCDHPSKSSELELSTEQLEALNLSYLFQQLQSMNIDECGVCADGCDEQLQFESENQEFFIRFTNDDSLGTIISELEQIRLLVGQMRNE